MLHFTQTTAYSADAARGGRKARRAECAGARREAGGRGPLAAQGPSRLRTLFVAQVGDERDHERGFGDPAADDASGKPGIAHRRAFHWGKGVGGDIGGKVAAALAMAADQAPRRPRGPR